MINSIFSYCNQILQSLKHQAYQMPDSMTTFATRTVATAAVAAMGFRCLSLFSNSGKKNWCIPIASVGAGGVAAALKLSPLKIAATALGTYSGCKFANYLSPLPPKLHEKPNSNPREIHSYGNSQDEFPRIVVKAVDLQNAQIKWSNNNKKYVYEKLLKDRQINRDFTFQKFSLSPTHAQDLYNLPIFPSESSFSVSSVKGGFCYPESRFDVQLNRDIMHWTANFADPNLFGYCFTSLFAQDEMQVAEHPALAHFKSLCPDAQLNNDQIALFTDVERLGAIDSTNIYGRNFPNATKDTLDKAVKRLDPPTLSNIFAFAAPRAEKEGDPYSYDNLEKLFFRAYLAFKSIKINYGADKRIHIHTGNWGAGAFGNCPKTVALLQIAAARLAKVDQVVYYRMNFENSLEEAIELWKNIGNTHKNFTVQQFLQHLADNAMNYGLIYGKGNGT